MTNVANESSLHLKTLKTNVPSEYASSARVRQWLLQHLENRKVALVNGPEAFVCLWNGAELHSLHPNHIFGSLISQGVAPQTAHHVVGDVMECLQDYRARRAASAAAGQVWNSEPESEPEAQQEEAQKRPESGGEQRVIDEEADREALVKQFETPRSWYSSWFTARGGVVAAGFSLAAGLGVMAWWMLSPPSKKEEKE
ncbi:uncharacterized protein CTRU02_215360 [Colletotrichum truncatum]|uniref:Uncharacterized protein n=1 Tax=Colletotrichum truncatum TaxID=5467 RepID=A0ACC3YD42_COLTU